MKIEELIVRDNKLLSTTVSFFMILLIFINLNFNFSSFIDTVIGVIASAVYFLINGCFLGCAFFENEDLFLRFMLGYMLLITCLALVAWVVLIVYNLNIVGSILVLCIVCSLSSFLNKKRKTK